MSEDQIQDLLNKLSQNEMRLGESISAITQSHSSLEVRVRALEAAAQNRAITEAREDERDKSLYDRLTRIEKKIEGLETISGEIANVKIDVANVKTDVGSIKGGVSKVLWAIALAVVLAIVGFILKGGLT